MNLFGNKPEERAMAALIHDTNSALDTLNNNLKGLDMWMKENKPDSSKPFVHIEYIRDRAKKIELALDEYYKKAQNGFVSE